MSLCLTLTHLGSHDAPALLSCSLLTNRIHNTHHVDSLAASFFSPPWFHSLCFLDRYFRYAEEKLRREEAGEAAADGFSATATFLTSAKEPAPASCDQRGERRSAQQQQAPAHGRSRHGNLGNGRCVGDDPGEGGGGGAVGQIKRAMLSGLQRVTDVFRSLDRNGDGRASAGLDPSTSGRSSGRSPSPAASMPAPFSARPARTPALLLTKRFPADRHHPLQACRRESSSPCYRCWWAARAVPRARVSTQLGSNSV